MNAEPLVRTYPEFWLYIALAILVASVIGLVVQWFQNRRATRDFLRVSRAPDTATDYRDSLARHARELQLKETRR